MIVAKISITLKTGILDPQGKTVHRALESLGFGQIEEVRMGKFIELRFNDVTAQEAQQLTTDACEKLLANPVIEQYRFELVEDNGQA
ncbi:phosphoribosylformylglycinamidine synthase subunit PurS [bacterium]|nr:phosphoribosylformylglycinamidine synthase subunit PurS [bacterium]